MSGEPHRDRDLDELIAAVRANMARTRRSALITVFVCLISAVCCALLARANFGEHRVRAVVWAICAFGNVALAFVNLGTYRLAGGRHR